MDIPSSPSPPTSTEVAFTTFALGATTGVLVLMGAVSSLFGPLLVSFTHRFHLSLADAGVSLSVYFVGALVGVAPSWLGLKRREGRVVLRVALMVIAAGALGASLSRVWVVFLVGVFLVGVGFGALDIAVNTLLARTNLEGRAHRLSVANGGYGVGAVLCPLVIIALAPRHFPWLLAGLGVLALALATLNRGVHAPRLRADPHQSAITAQSARRRPILVTFAVAYVVYVALETSSAGWMATQIHGIGDSAVTGSLVTAGFWSGLAVGRFLGGALYRRVAERALVLGGLLAAVALCAAARVDALALVAYPLLGLVVASVFPMGLVWYANLCPHDSDGLSTLILVMMVGGVVGPGAVSLLVARYGVHAVPWALAAFAAVDVVAFLTALRFRPLVADPADAGQST